MKKEFEKERKDNQTEDLFWDMPDMDDDEKFSQWLEDEYLKEADAIEESLLSGRRYEDHPEIVQKLSVSRESFYQRAREEGLLDEETDEHVTAENPAMGTETDISKEEPICADVCVSGKNMSEAKASGVEMPETKVVEFRKKKHSYVRLGRIAGIAGVCLLCVFAASMSSEANRNHFIKKVQYLTGNDARIVVGNDDENEDIKTDEYEAIRDIENKLSIVMPELYYRPYGMEYFNYEVSELTASAKIEYLYNSNSLLFFIDKQNVDTASNISSLNGTEKIVDIVDNGDLVITIKEVEDSKDKFSTYIAGWTFDNTSYYIAGKIELKELKKILKEMKF